jgi:hypothetical protein
MCIKGPPEPGKTQAIEIAGVSSPGIRPDRGRATASCASSSYELGVRHRARVQPDRNQSGDVGHVHDHLRADCLGDDGDAGEVDHTRIRARAHHDHLRRVLMRAAFELVVVDALVVLANAVGDDRVQLAGEVQRVAVREVAAMGQIHAEDRVAGVDDRQVHRHVRLCARMRLHVGVVGAEERLGAGDGQRLPV